MESGRIEHPDAVRSHLGCIIEAAVVQCVAHHPSCVERRHRGASRADQIVLPEIHSVVYVVIVLRMLEHRLHGVAALLDELDRRRFAVVGQSLAEAAAVRIAPVTHGGLLRLRKDHLLVVESAHVLGAVEHRSIPQLAA
ncbi:hypothetical protein GCM10020258_27360 [Sphingomonas yabuuchiae]